MQRERVDREIAILKMCNHPNIVKLVETYESDDEISLVMELYVPSTPFPPLPLSIPILTLSFVSLPFSFSPHFFPIRSLFVPHFLYPPSIVFPSFSLFLYSPPHSQIRHFKIIIFTDCGGDLFYRLNLVLLRGNLNQ